MMKPVTYCALLIGSVLSTVANAGDYHLIKEVVAADSAHGDFISVDAAARRLYVTHDTEVVVMDLDKLTVVGRVSNLAGAHGVAIASDLGLGFISNGRNATVTVIELATLKNIGSVPAGDKPDAIVYEPSNQEVYAFNGHSNSVTIISAKSRQVISTLALPGKPEFAVADGAMNRVYVNIEDRNVVGVIDTKTHQLVAQWPIAPGAAATGMAFDAQHHRLIIGCDNQRMLMIDSHNGKVLSSVPIGEGVDATAFDEATSMAFSSNGESGTVTIASATDKLKVMQTLKTEPGAGTMALDPVTHNIYLSTATKAGATKNAPPVASKFTVLVYGTGQ